MTRRRQTLSVCCLAVEPPAQVAELLRQFRPVADEVIVAVDSRVDPAELGPYHEVADRTVRYEYDVHPDRARPWLYSQCQGDWLFSIDGDEVPSPALTAALPELIARHDRMQYAFPRRWLFPDAAHWLEELPWWPDFQVRLVRNGPTVRHTAQVHGSFVLTYPMEHVGMPIYHLALVAVGTEERRRRGARYEAESPGRVAYGGGGLNDVIYVPEDHVTKVPRAVPPADVAMIERVLEAGSGPRASSGVGHAVPLVTREEIRRHLPPVDLAGTDYQSGISAVAESGQMVPGEVRPVYVRIENRGAVPWHWGLDHEPRISLGHHWVTPDGDRLPDDGRRSPLTATVEPGSGIVVPTFVEAPRRPGRYVLQVDLVHENVRWFGSPVSIDIHVAMSSTRRVVRPASSMLVTTIVARNYLPRARVLAASFRDHHPNGQFVALVIDGEATFHERFEVIRPTDLSIDAAELHRMAAIYDVLELATALKPFLLRHLLFDRGAPSVTYLDPDIEVFAPLDDLDQLTREVGIVLTPHRLDPVPSDGRQPGERDLMRAGAFNLGCIGVSPLADEFLARWSEHCRRNCIIAHDQGYFVDQRWVDVGVVAHPHHVVRDLGCNVAYWNLDSRPITAGPEGYLVDGWPLRFLHFSGFDPAVPHLLSRHQGTRPRLLLSEQPVLRDLLLQYARRVAAATRPGDVATEYGWARTAGGIALDPLIRGLLRDEVLRRELAPSGRAGSVGDLPDVFTDHTDDGLVALLSSPLPGSEVPRVPRLLHQIYLQRPDVQQAYPNLRGDGLQAFFHWVRNSGRLEHQIPDRLIPSPPPSGARPRRRTRLKRGVNVIGYFTAELGVGEGGRALLATLDQLDEPYAVVNETSTSNRQQHQVDRPFDDPQDFDINVVCVNSDQTPRVMERLATSLRDDQYTVGVWAWELEEFPHGMLGGVPYVDEIWTNSWHAVRSIGRAIDKPVRHVPLPVVAMRSIGDEGRPLLIDAGFTFLYCFDFHSIPERKNPIAVVRAFRQAFAPGEGPALVVKSINGVSELTAFEQLWAAADGRSDIRLVDRYLDTSGNRALIAGCDCYVSLHRAEGFGYTMAEAMLAGKPVIATGYSGNLDFMNESNSFLVGYTPVPVPPGCGPYPVGAIWAEPDIDDAARLMRLVYENRELAARVGLRAQEHIADVLSPEAMAPLVAARLADIRARTSSDVRAGDTAFGLTVGRLAWRATTGVGRLLGQG